MAASAAVSSAFSAPSSAWVDGGRTVTAAVPQCVRLPSLPAPSPLPTREARRPLAYCRKITRNVISLATGDSVAPTAVASAEPFTSTAEVTTDTTTEVTTEANTETTAAATTDTTTADTTETTTAEVTTETTAAATTETTTAATAETTAAEVTTETTAAATTDTTTAATAETTTAEVTNETTVAVTTETTNEVTTELPEIVKTIQDAWDKVEDKYAVSSLAFAGFVGLVGAAGAISAIDRLPLVPGLLEVVGIGYTGWFAYKNLTKKTNREALIAKIKSTYKEIIGSD